MLLTGELGAGKTALVQRVFACLGASETVTSPTYERIHEHQLTTVGKLGIHVDAYEIDRFRVEELEEVWQLPNTIVCVEWADKLPEGSIPGDRPVWRLDLELGPDGTRACSYS
jgi:tRNA threonylcarbamoyl adenosine modification protein YjeE